MDILINHLGYETTGYKKAVVRLSGAETQSDQPVSARIVDADNPHDSKMECTPEHTGRVAQWKDWDFWVVDFSALCDPGKYRVSCSAGSYRVISEPFEIEERLLVNRTVPAVLRYFRSQRCSGANDEADRNALFYGSREDRMDIHGGWFEIDTFEDYRKRWTILK